MFLFVRVLSLLNLKSCLGFEQCATFSPTQNSPTEIDSEEIFFQVQAKYNNALHDYWRLAAVDFEKSNDLYIND